MVSILRPSHTLEGVREVNGVIQRVKIWNVGMVGASIAPQDGFDIIWEVGVQGRQQDATGADEDNVAERDLYCSQLSDGNRSHGRTNLDRRMKYRYWEYASCCAGWL